MMSAVDAAPSEDEFDALPDAYAGIDFDKIEALCGHPRPTTPSSEYLFDDLDEATLAEIDAIEARALQSVDATETVSTPDNALELWKEPVCPPTPTSKQRVNRTDDPLPPKTPRKRPHAGPSVSPRKKRIVSSSTREHVGSSPKSHSKSPPSGSLLNPMRAARPTASQTVRKVLADVGDELTCPICCELFVCVQIGSTCGHSYCGKCAWDWIAKTMPTPTCPNCRTPLDKQLPMIPNFAIESMVQKHVATLAENNVEGWDEEGELRLEWVERQELWKVGAAARARVLGMHNENETTPAPVSPSRPRRERLLNDLGNGPEG